MKAFLATAVATVTLFKEEDLRSFHNDVASLRVRAAESGSPGFDRGESGRM